MIKKITQQLFESFSKQDISFLRAKLTEDATLTSDGGRTEIKGTDAIVSAVAMSFELVPDLQVEIKHLFVEGDYAIAEVVRTGNHAGTLRLPDGAEIKPTGNTVYLPEVIILKFSDDKIVKMSVYTDQLDTQKQLGML
ncbi:MAG: ester cyclase [Thermonemataceae bacterium]